MWCGAVRVFEDLPIDGVCVCVCVCACVRSCSSVYILSHVLSSLFNIIRVSHHVLTGSAAERDTSPYARPDFGASERR